MSSLLQFYFDKALIAQLKSLKAKITTYAIAEYSIINIGSLYHLSKRIPYPSIPISTKNGAKNK